jgi:hypothetical protein
LSEETRAIHVGTADGRLAPHDLEHAIPCWAREALDFHKTETGMAVFLPSISINARGETPRLARGLRENGFPGCTKSGHRVVDGLHSIENTDSYSV